LLLRVPDANVGCQPGYSNIVADLKGDDLATVAV
jgi:hypothetical protein